MRSHGRRWKARRAREMEIKEDGEKPAACCLADSSRLGGRPSVVALRRRAFVFAYNLWVDDEAKQETARERLHFGRWGNRSVTASAARSRIKVIKKLRPAAATL